MGTFAPFSPCFIFPTELSFYGLPTPDVQNDIMSLVQMASSLIDTYCGRIDGDGNGSLIWTTYVQRVLLQTRNRNLVEIPMKPIVAVTQQQINVLQAAASGSPGGNYWYTGVQPSTYTAPNGYLSGILGASGRYGYTRQDMSIAYPDLFAFINPLNLVTMFGGPAPWVAIDVTNTDYDYKTGEMWVPAGLQLQKYSEVYFMYNSGYDPNNLPRGLKFATAMLVKNAMLQGDGTTMLMSMNMGRGGPNAQFYPKGLLDPTLQVMLTPFCNVRSY